MLRDTTLNVDLRMPREHTNKKCVFIAGGGIFFSFKKCFTKLESETEECVKILPYVFISFFIDVLPKLRQVVKTRCTDSKCK